MRRRGAFRFAFHILAVAALMLFAAAPSFVPSLVAAQPDCVAFPETGKSVCGKFLAYWQEHGGLQQQGYPISEPFQEKSDVDGKTYLVQYFERAVFELHPENQPPHDILLSLLGSIHYKQKYPDGAPGQKSNNSPGSVLFAGTSRRVGGRFLEYWERNGGLAQQGYPISDEFAERSELDGETYTVQYFERAVFELHPGNKLPYDVLLSQLGMFQFKRKYAMGSASPGQPPGTGPWTELRQRPLNLPALPSSSSACPVTPPRRIDPPPPAGYAAEFGLGQGPIYPVARYFDSQTTLHIAGYVPGDARWYPFKVRWIGGPSYSGPVLVRGRQLDGDSKVGFALGGHVPTGFITELALDVSDGWNDWPSTTQVHGPGCFAYQVDGKGFSYPIVFRVVVGDPSRATPSPTPDIYAELRQRPLKTHRLSPGDPCPTSKSRPDVRPGIDLYGSGPVYLQRVPTGSEVDGELGLAPGMYVQNRDAYRVKGPWLSEPRYPGPILIRGHQLDGAGVIRFDYDQGSFSPEMMHGDSSSRGADSGWSFWPSTIWMPGPGCFDLQIDGLHFTNVIVLKAVKP